MKTKLENLYTLIPTLKNNKIILLEFNKQVSALTYFYDIMNKSERDTMIIDNFLYITTQKDINAELTTYEY